MYTHIQAQNRLTAFPADDWQFLRSPREHLLRLPQLLQLHGELALLDLVIGEDFEVAGETKPGADRDEPLGGVVLVPLNGVTVVHGELVVEVVVALTNRSERGDEVVTRGVLVVERCVTKPMCERVHAECGLYAYESVKASQRKKAETYVVDKAKTSSSGVEETTLPVTPAKSSNKHGEQQAAPNDEVNVPPVLPPDDRVLAQVTDIGNAHLDTWLEDHPADVRPPEALMRVVGVEVGVGVTVVSTVPTRPPLDGPFNGTSPGHGQEVLKRQRRVVRTVCPQTVVASGDT